ncbi:HNH endonuclease [Undibacterium sp. Ji50W]|uniref:HNH endonuclease n=1 Tax=Undibacterium sp. Ji50W TaxID=3413041 RepID=UPI003BF343B8
MRKFDPRPALSLTSLNKLSDKTAEIASSNDPKKRAEEIYKVSRTTVWFKSSVVDSLKKLSGLGERCMFCGSSEASQVDHFKPKATFPHLAMAWENYIWICSVCNQSKLDNFPLSSDGSSLLINPIDEDIWQFFSLDELGYILSKWDVAIDDVNVRSKTCETFYKFNRQAVQEARQKRICSLKEQVSDSILLEKFGYLSQTELHKRLQSWIEHPFHPEVPQYYLLGAGNVEEPFSTFLGLVNG